ncbi:P-loop containing nucleoside triphosphate hydrolase protein, partial [Auricularia subglabra TFB-10046 SS5]
KLSNVIVLTGPPGVGKSAAAHACAMELDWSVFEIYPGIGKRSGKSIVSLVGDAARNHHLGRAKARDDTPPGDAGLATEPAPLDGSPPESLSHDAAVRTVRQSLFLFDEVDILFREDANFWPTLARLVAESRRPVILTCNDISLVPLEDLPIQAILEFEPCEPELACSYLQHLAQLNGLHLDCGVARAIYARSSRGPARQDCSRGDLRQAINILQFW